MSGHDRVDDAELLARAPEEFDALEALYRRYVRRVAAYAARRRPTADDVADVVAGTFDRLLRYAHRYDPERGPVAAFVFAIAGSEVAAERRRDARDHALRSRLAGRDLLDGDDVARIEAAIDATASLAALAPALDSLSAAEGEMLRFVASGLSPAEAAALLDITPNAARGRLARARQRVRALAGTPEALPDPEPGPAPRPGRRRRRGLPVTAPGPPGPDRRPTDEDEGLPMDTIPPAPPPADEVLALPRFEERLLGVLRERQVAGTWAPAPGPGGQAVAGDRAADTASANGHRPAAGGPDRSRPPTDPHGPPAPRPGTRPSRPSRRRRALVAAAVAVAVVAGVAVAARSAGDDSPDLGTAAEARPDSTLERSDEGPVEPMPDEGQVHEALSRALASSVVHTTWPGHNEQWADPTTHTERILTLGADGQPLVDMGRSAAPDVDEPAAAPPGTAPSRVVDHCLRQYADNQEPLPSVGSWAESLLASLAADETVVDGTMTVDGRELVRLTDTLAALQTQAELDAALEYYQRQGGGEAGVWPPLSTTYLDPESLLPVLETGLDGAPVEIEFLPRTPENLALLVPPVPDGFTQVETPAPDDEPCR